jgi:predicted deacetylase
VDQFLVVAIHDVAPPNSDGVRWLVRELDRMGIDKRVLKVVPHWKGREPIADDGPLVDLLSKEEAHASEIVVHGLTHATSGPLRGGWPTRARARLFAGADAEFVCYATNDAFNAARNARAELEALGLSPRGFCAPAWLAGPGIDGVLASIGYEFAVKFSGIVDLRHQRWLRAPAIGYMGAGPVAERLTRLENALTLRWPRAPRVLRVFLHPRNASTSPACAAILRALPGLATDRELVTYAELLS